jgi:shikimate dehydrogenase
VWGSPIHHSLSPALHNAAYKQLGLDAYYDLREVSVEHLATTLSEVSPEHRGISLTMPLKEMVLSLVEDHRGLVDELGAANTIVRGPEGWLLWNTDPAGVRGALSEASLAHIDTATLLGAGATARSVLCALPGFGVSAVMIFSRDRARARQTLDYAQSKGLSVSWAPLEQLGGAGPSDLVVSSLPHGVSVAESIPLDLVSSAALFDVSYNPWPSALATVWQGSVHPVVSGLSMLLHQAVAQIRIFTTGNPDTPLANEDRVVAAMREAIA